MAKTDKIPADIANHPEIAPHFEQWEDEHLKLLPVDQLKRILSGRYVHPSMASAFRVIQKSTLLPGE